LHWDGKRWRFVDAPEMLFSAVAATSTNDVWAVGKANTAVVLHWNGSRWQTLLRRPGADLRALVVLSPTDVWVVGSEPLLKVPRFLELHWDGKRWSSYSQPSPNGGYGPDQEPELVAISAAAADDIWTAGDASNSGEPAYPDTVLLHWNGSSWRRAPAPEDQFVGGLTLREPGDLWLAGLHADGDAYGAAYLQQRVGKNWKPVALDLRPRRLGPSAWSTGAIESLAADQAHGFWAVGYSGSWPDPLSFPTHTRSLIEHAQCT
jgi:hypothetical protein